MNIKAQREEMKMLWLVWNQVLDNNHMMMVKTLMNLARERLIRRMATMISLIIFIRIVTKISHTEDKKIHIMPREEIKKNTMMKVMDSVG